MSGFEKGQKIRLYKVAAEYNLSHESLLDFLQKRGFEVKNHMSLVTDDMLELLEKHFKREKVDAERHAKKKKEYDEQERRRKSEKEDAEKPLENPISVEPVATVPEPEPVQPVEELVPAPEEPPTEVPAVEDVSTIPPEVEEPEIPEPVIAETPEEAEPETIEEEPRSAPEAQVEERGTEEPAPLVETEQIPPAPTEEPTPDPVPSPKKKVEPAPEPTPPPKKELDVSIEASVPKMGLNIQGKIDLEKANQKARQSDPRNRDKTARGTGREKGAKDKNDSQQTTLPEDSASSLLGKKKKKKRIIEPGKPATTTPEKLDLETLRARAAASKKGRKPGKAREVDAEEVNDAIKRTIASMSDVGPASSRAQLRKKKRARRQEEIAREIERSEAESKIIKIYEYATVNELAGLMKVPPSGVISSLIAMGVMASINQRLDLDTITLVASEFGFEIQKNEDVSNDMLEDVEDETETLEARPPIVTIMGHVDHGKTSLLDHIRNSNVVAGESGGITQHIGAYTVQLDNGRKISFLDTPGHEAFTAMRARGAQVTDIVVLVVAADDNVMPQTVEAISHALAAGVPIVVAINKIDKPEANPERIKQQLADRNILVEDWGGRYGVVPISAKKGINIQQLLDRIILEADLLELKANHDRAARGVVIEAQLDKGKGIIATVLVQKGTLRVGDTFVAGIEFGRVRAMLDERGNKLDEAPPSTPAQVLGFNGMPQAGDVFVVTEGERQAREIAVQRQQIKRETDFRRQHRTTLDEISEQIKIGGVQELSLIVKADVDGSVEALSDSLLRLSTAEVKVSVIHKGVGAIAESDVLLATASQAIIIGFRVRPNLNARRLAEAESIDIRSYEIIYDAINDVKQALEGLLRPDVSEKVVATIAVREVFKVSHIGSIAGCYVQDGKIKRNDKVRLLRDGVVIFNGTISSLKRFKDDVREVDTNFECGIALEGFNDLKIGDVIEAYERVEVKRTLS